MAVDGCCHVSLFLEVGWKVLDSSDSSFTFDDSL